MPRDVLILWNESNWRCEMHTEGIPSQGRFVVYRDDSSSPPKGVHLGAAAYARAEILRQRYCAATCTPN